eukprot:6201062-Pleurochrysis_carterae.AAC.1
MGWAYDLLEEAMVAAADNGAYLYEPTLISVFENIADEPPSFKQYLETDIREEQSAQTRLLRHMAYLLFYLSFSLSLACAYLLLAHRCARPTPHKKLPGTSASWQRRIRQRTRPTRPPPQ